MFSQPFSAFSTDREIGEPYLSTCFLCIISTIGHNKDPTGDPILLLDNFHFLHASADGMLAITEKAKVLHHLKVCF